MVLRSIGRTLDIDDKDKRRERLKTFKQECFKEIKILINKMEKKELTEDDILASISKITDPPDISFGQAQKPINVILKYHYYLFHDSDENNKIKKELFCPIDSRVLNKLGGYSGLALSRTKKDKFLEIQNKISEQGDTKIDYDLDWDKEHLEDEGLL